MCITLVIASHFTQNYHRANNKTPILIKVRILGKAKKGKACPIKGRPPNQLKINPTLWRLGLHD